MVFVFSSEDVHFDVIRPLFLMKVVLNSQYCQTDDWFGGFHFLGLCNRDVEEQRAVGFQEYLISGKKYFVNLGCTKVEQWNLEKIKLVLP